MPIGNIDKFMVTKENYKAFKHAMGLHKETLIFEIPALGIFTDALALKSYYAEHSLTDNVLNSYADNQKLFVTYERT